MFVGGHFALGFIVGPAAIDLVAGSGVLAAAAVAVVVLAAIGALGWRRSASVPLPGNLLAHR